MRSIHDDDSHANALSKSAGKHRSEPCEQARKKGDFMNALAQKKAFSGGPDAIRKAW